MISMTDASVLYGCTLGRLGLSAEVFPEIYLPKGRGIFLLICFFLTHMKTSL